MISKFLFDLFFLSVSYMYPMGKNVYVDLSSISSYHESKRITVSKEQIAMYSEMDIPFELCKICSVNRKNCQIDPCKHLICEDCLTDWQVDESSHQFEFEFIVFSLE